MNVREKLMELVNDVLMYLPWGEIQNDTSECIVDRMMDHNVTVQECWQWIYDFNLAGSNFYRCSVCDRQETLLEKEDIYEYCPFCHCGAKMIPQPPKGE